MKHKKTKQMKHSVAGLTYEHKTQAAMMNTACPLVVITGTIVLVPYL